jgi:hypothetical protein
MGSDSLTEPEDVQKDPEVILARLSASGLTELNGVNRLIEAK